MRRTYTIIGVVVAVIILIIVGVMYFAASNLNTLVQKNRTTLLARASAAAGRKVDVKRITVSLGWGVTVDLNGLTVADDPSFSNHNFLDASDALVRVELLPLLSRHVHITRLILVDPEVRIIKNADGVMNISTLGKRHHAPGNTGPTVSGAAQPMAASPAEAQPARRKSTGKALNEVAVNSLKIQNGTIYYDDRSQSGGPVVLKHVTLDLENFSPNSRFNLKLALAAMSDTQNVALSGQAGPLMHDGKIDVRAMPLKLSAAVGPLTLASLRQLPMVAAKIPRKLELPDPISATANLSGTLDALKLRLASDLSADRVIYQGVFNKPAGVTLKLAAEGARTGGQVKVSQANVTLADMQLKASNVTIGGGSTSARIDTNNFNLAGVAATLAALGKYQTSGKAEVHADVRMASGAGVPEINGTVALSEVGLKPSAAKTAMVSGVTGQIKLAGNSARVGPLNFLLGSSGHATLTANAKSLRPLDAVYNLSADTIKLAEVVPSRPPGEHLDQVRASGTAAGAPGAMTATVNLTSPSGVVQGVDYRNLGLDAELEGRRVTVRSLKLNAFSGAIDAKAVATLSPVPVFDVAANLNNIDLQQALASQKAKAAGIVRGLLSGAIQAAGSGKTFDQIKPTLKGSGRIHLVKAKLVGVNVAAQALGKIENLPGIGALVPQQVIARHPELFSNPNTDIDDASLTFALAGPRITSHDIVIKSADYWILGDGWFDMDKNIDLAAQLLLTPSLTREIIAAKKNVVYVTNNDGQVAIPMRVVGTLPKPNVVPDVSTLASNAASRALKKKGEKLLGGFLGKKTRGLGGFLGGANPNSTPAPNPLENLRKLF